MFLQCLQRYFRSISAPTRSVPPARRGLHGTKPTVFFPLHNCSANYHYKLCQTLLRHNISKNHYVLTVLVFHQKTYVPQGLSTRKWKLVKTHFTYTACIDTGFSLCSYKQTWEYRKAVSSLLVALISGLISCVQINTAMINFQKRHIRDRQNVRWVNRKMIKEE